MTLKEIDNLVKKSEFASIGFLDKDGNPSIRRVFSTWHKGLGGHLISTNTSSEHVQALLKNNRACLYFDNCQTFQGVCFIGTVIVHFDQEHKAMIWNKGDEKYTLMECMMKITAFLNFKQIMVAITGMTVKAIFLRMSQQNMIKEKNSQIIRKNKVS